jgi:hypothetical protein
MSDQLYNITKNNNSSESLVILGAVRYGSVREGEGEGESQGLGEREGIGDWGI